MSSKGQMQQPEINDDRRLQDNTSEREAAVMMSIEDGGDRGHRRRESADSVVQD